MAWNPDGGIVNDRDWSAFVYAWGQFLDHDIGLTDAGSLMPFNTAGLANANDAHRVANTALFLAGDVR